MKAISNIVDAFSLSSMRRRRAENKEKQFLPADFSSKEYLDLHPDVRAAGIDPTQHYLEYGMREGRQYRRGVTFTSSGMPYQRQISVYCADYGWLFEDLKRKFGTSGGVTPANEPDPNAGAWICIRTAEAQASPDLTRTIVQVHDLYDYDVLAYSDAALVLFTHPCQLWHWRKRGFAGRGMVLPIGARSGIPIAREMPACPTIGFFCGETPKMEKQSLLFREVVQAARADVDFDVLMIGRNLEHIRDLGTWYDRAAEPDDYRAVDVLFTASVSPAIPLSVYEACSIGVPVISTPRWFPIPNWPNIYMAESCEALVACVRAIVTYRAELYRGREASKFSPYLLENWIEFQIDFCRKIAVP